MVIGIAVVIMAVEAVSQEGRSEWLTAAHRHRHRHRY